MEFTRTLFNAMVIGTIDAVSPVDNLGWEHLRPRIHTGLLHLGGRGSGRHEVIPLPGSLVNTRLPAVISPSITAGSYRTALPIFTKAGGRPAQRQRE